MQSNNKIVKFSKKEARVMTDEQATKQGYQDKNERIERNRRFQRLQKQRNRNNECFDQGSESGSHRRINNTIKR